MKYPHVLTEDETIDMALGGRSISRLGDGELRIVLGGHAASQMGDPVLAQELRDCLGKASSALVCIPSANPLSPKAANWRHYAHANIVKLYKLNYYGSAFITRPDSAPWINRPDYWEKIRALWIGKDVTLVTGEPIGSGKMMGIGDGARSLRRIDCPRQHAFARVKQIEEEIGKPSGIVILCLGATATVLAVRLANKGGYAVDLGHVGMFMRRQSISKPEGL